MDALRVVAYNAHMGEMPSRLGLGLSLGIRHPKILQILLHHPLAPSTIFMIQEAGQLLALLAKAYAKNHVAYYQNGDGKPMNVLTLVPKTLIESEDATVETLRFNVSPMRRQCHIVLVRGMALVNAHLESCADGARVREQQVIEIGNRVQKLRELKKGTYGYAIFGDLNGYTGKTGRRVAHLAHGVEVTQGRSVRYVSYSPHRLHEFTVSA
jgi:hypothetical protein